MREILQHAKIIVVQPQVVRYTCDGCGEVCGTRANPKRTYCSTPSGLERHYCHKNCGGHRP